MSNVNMADGRNDALSRPLMHCIKSSASKTFLMLSWLELYVENTQIQIHMKVLLNDVCLLHQCV